MRPESGGAEAAWCTSACQRLWLQRLSLPDAFGVPGPLQTVKAMDFFEVVRRRHSIRAYQRRQVEEAKLRFILECANAAPSAGNLQAYEIVVVTDDKARQALARAALDQEYIAQAPVVLVFWQNPHRSAIRYGRRGVELYSLQDATIACTYAQLAATALGLASCWVGAFAEEPICRLLKAPPGVRPVALLPIGYPAEEPSLTGRRPLNEVVRWETF